MAVDDRYTRRSFLRRAGASTAVLTVPSFLGACERGGLTSAPQDAPVLATAPLSDNPFLD